MKTGKAKFDAGFPNSLLKPHEHSEEQIKKDSLWELPDNYDFKSKNAIFSEVKEAKDAVRK